MIPCQDFCQVCNGQTSALSAQHVLHAHPTHQRPLCSPSLRRSLKRFCSSRRPPTRKSNMRYTMYSEQGPLARSWYVVLVLRALSLDLTDSCIYRKRATWTVPAEQIGIAERGAPAAQNGNGSPRPPSRKSSGTGSSPTTTTPVVTHEVALKIIAKKKVKGNEASVWGEMDVLRGLDHPNIVAFLLLPYLGGDIY
jgi:hypothetical protein